ncbi:MAG: type II toxin-antitoxin system VapC family toxin [candidate division NC10 bacterium]|nr:type II toxin-antitoxin system VapC family toxin [candidate division NC10 bacterium]
MAATYFLDTSALVKRYHVERGTAHLDAVFAEPDATFIIASITIAELTSALVRKREEGEIPREALLRILSKFSEDLIAEFWILDIERHHIQDAQELILRHGLRTLDSLQLSLLLVTKALSPVFLCSDVRLLAAARAEGITVQDPSAIA